MSADTRVRGSRWVRSEAVLLRRTIDGLLLHTEWSEEPVLVRGSGVLAWELLDHPLSVAELADLLADVHDVDADQVRLELGPFLERLRTVGAVAMVP